MNILFVGNSFTYYNNMPLILETLAQENGYDIHTYTFAKGGHKLCQYTEEAEKYAEFEAMYTARHYDLCVLQEYSTLPIDDFKAFLRGTMAIVRKTRGYVDRYLFYQTWGFKDGHPQMVEWKTNHAELGEKLRRAYSAAALEFGFSEARVGTAFHQVVMNHPEIELYHEDQKHPSYAGSVLAALVLYRTILGEMPGTFDSIKLEPDVLACLVTAASDR